MAKGKTEQKTAVSEARSYPGDARYLVHQDGRIIGPSGRLLRGSIQPNGYIHLWVGGKLLLAHRIMLETFRGQSNGRQGNHLDGNKHNNALDNLEWATPSENNRHRFRVLSHVPARGERNGKHKLTDEQVCEARSLQASGLSLRKIGALLGVTSGYLSRMLRGQYRAAA